MAYLDAHNLYSDAQAVTTTADSTNVIDHGVDGNLGVGEPLVVVISLDVALDDGNGDETYACLLETDSVEAMSSATLVGSVAIMTRGDAAGTKYYIDLPASSSMERYSQLTFTHGGTSPTGTYTARLVPRSFLQNDQYYASGYTVS